MSRKYTYEEVKDIIEENGYELVSDEYVNNRQKLTLKDTDGYLYETKLSNVLAKKHPRKFSKFNPYTIQNIALWVTKENKNFNLLSKEYNISNKNLKWKCSKPECNEVFVATWDNIRSGKGCSFCSGKKVGISNCLMSINPKLASEWHLTKNGNLTPYDVTSCSDKKVWWECSLKHEWESSISDRNRGRGCPYCSGKLPTIENNLLIKNPDLCKEWNYEKNNKCPENYLEFSHSKVWWICHECDNEWKASVSDRSSGNGCPSCKMSRGEKSIEKFFIEKNIKHISQYKFNDCKNIFQLPFDFYLPVYNILIEYQGIQHYKPRQFGGISLERAKENLILQKLRDKIKTEYCKNNNIKLIKIPYWNLDNIEEILIKELKL